jgi:hypothetical protein
MIENSNGKKIYAIRKKNEYIEMDNVYHYGDDGEEYENPKIYKEDEDKLTEDYIQKEYEDQLRRKATILIHILNQALGKSLKLAFCYMYDIKNKEKYEEKFASNDSKNTAKSRLDALFKILFGDDSKKQEVSDRRKREIKRLREKIVEKFKNYELEINSISYDVFKYLFKSDLLSEFCIPLLS